MSWILALLLSPVGFPQSEAAKAEIDYSKVDRKIGKQPVYVAKPLYAIFLLDAEGKRPMWAVLDCSRENSSLYDVVHLDLNGNGDLVDEGERFAAAAADLHPDWAVIRIGTVKVLGADLRHTGFTIQTVLREKGIRGSFNLKWGDKESVSGGLGQEDPDAEWSTTLDRAPVFHPWPYGVLRFCLWDISNEENKFQRSTFDIGKRNRVRLLVGNAGWGPTSFSAVSETFLDLNKDKLLITLIYRNEKDEERRLSVPVKEHC